MPRTNIYDGHSGSSASARVSRAVGVTLKRNLFQIVRFLSFILTCGYGMINMVVCVVFPSFFRRVEAHHTGNCYAGCKDRK